MEITGLPILEDAVRRHADARGPLEAWLKEAPAARWGSPTAIRSRFGSADSLVDNRVIFNIKGKSYRLLAKIDDSLGALRVLSFGTHAQYHRKKIPGRGAP